MKFSLTLFTATSKAYPKDYFANQLPLTNIFFSLHTILPCFVPWNIQTEKRNKYTKHTENLILKLLFFSLEDPEYSSKAATILLEEYGT